MSGSEVATVRWGSHSCQASLYGSALTTRASGEVRLVNPLMPGGTTLQEWYSSTSYQALRATPSLPLLHHGRRYRIDPRVVSVPADTFLFEVRFVDRFGEVVRAEILRAPDYDFEYPQDCAYYTLRLVNAGCDELRFESLTLLEADAHG
ncbi:MAG: accessory Sec system protein Asp3 [Promicromonosporaceae bacterium]|nr:accessory Sec system protein Asp3 [Promicromonosporaceae bacterium]